MVEARLAAAGSFVLAALAALGAGAAPETAPVSSSLPEPLAAAAGVPRDLLYAVLDDGRLAAQYAVDGHLHSEVSGDSHTSVHELVAVAARRAIDALVFTDHASIAVAPLLAAEDAHRPPGARPLLVLGEEAGAPGAHVGLWNVHHHSRRAPFDPVSPVLGILTGSAEHDPEALSVLNHPGWKPVGGAFYRASFFDPRLPGPKFEAIELWNGRTYLRLQTRQLIERWEDMLAHGLRPSIVASSDAHHGLDVGTPRTIVLAPALDAAALVGAVRAGRTYLTDDARIDFTVNGHLPGDTLVPAPASDEPWAVRVRGWSARGGTLRILAGPPAGNVVLATELSPGRFDVGCDFAPPAPPADGWLRVELVRRDLFKGHPIDFVALVSAPVYWDAPPLGDFWAARPGAWKKPPYLAARVLPKKSLSASTTSRLTSRVSP